MNWGSWQNFIEMGGRGFYVWGSYGITLACIVLEVFLLTRQKRSLLRQLTQMLKLKKQS